MSGAHYRRLLIFFTSPQKSADFRGPRILTWFYISLIVERLFHRKLPTVSQTNPRQPRFQRLLESIQIIYRPSHIILIIIMMVHKHHHYYFIPLVFSLVLFYPMFFYLLSTSSLYLFYPLSIFSLYLFL